MSVANRKFWILTAALVLLAVFLRVYQIDLRPLHNDEGVNFHFTQQMNKLGYYPYSHENYHGPSYFYFLSLSVWLFGPTEFGLRFPSVVMGLGCMLLILMLRKTEGDRFCLLAMALIAVSSSLVFHSRYAIHEMFFVFSGALYGISLYLWHRLRDKKYVYLAGLGLGLIIATKETFIITGFCIFVAFWTISWPGFVTGIYRYAKEPALKVFSGSQNILTNLWYQRQLVFYGFLISLLVIVVLFSGGFRWMGGLRELFLGVPQWIGRNKSDVGHFKPFWYYASIIMSTGFFKTVDIVFGSTIVRRLYQTGPAELPLVLIFIMPLVTALISPKKLWSLLNSESYSFARFTFFWSLLSFLVYSYVSYKTPWLIVNITFPATLCLAVFLKHILESFRRVKIFAVSLIGAVICLSFSLCWYYNFTFPYGPGNPYSYVHTHQGMIDLVEDIDRYRENNSGSRVLVAVNSYWPLPYYLKHLSSNLGYVKSNNFDYYSKEYDVLIFDKSVNVDRAGWARKYYRLTDGQETYTFFKRKQSGQYYTPYQ